MSPPSGMQKLSRIFSLVPLICNKQGIELDKLQKLAGFGSSEELLRCLKHLMMFGAPPFSPSDFISIDVDEKERVWLDFPLGLERPLALSSAEWALIQKLIRKELDFIAQKGFEDMESLEESVPDPISESLRELLARFGDVPTIFDTDEQFLSQRNVIREALADKLQLEFLYRSLSSKEAELRRVDPWILFKNRGNSYLIGYCYTRAAVRCFLLERMKNLELLDLEQERPPPENIRSYLELSPLFQKEPKGFRIKIAFVSDLLANLKISFNLENIKPYKRKKQEGTQEEWLCAESKIQDSLWLRSILRSFGTQMILLGPVHLRESYLEELSAFPIPESF